MFKIGNGNFVAITGHYQEGQFSLIQVDGENCDVIDVDPKELKKLALFLKLASEQMEGGS